VGKRSQDAAAAMQQLAADIADSGPKAQSISQELNATKGQLQTCKDSTLKLTTEITSLKEKVNSHAEQLQQKQDAAKNKTTQEAEAELQKVREQLKQKEEQVKKLEAELKQQQGATKPGEQQAQAAAPVSADAVAARLHALETAGLQCNVIKDQEVSGAMHMIIVHA
jgi:chromosome segregation ATPase